MRQTRHQPGCVQREKPKKVTAPGPCNNPCNNNPAQRHFSDNRPRSTAINEKNQPQLNKQDKETLCQLKLIDDHTDAVLDKFLPRQSLCKAVCYHNSSWSILQRYFSSFYLFPNKVMMNIDMLGASMVLGIVRKSNAFLVICNDGDRRELLVLAIQNLTE
jgi:hypothetical protein